MKTNEEKKFDSQRIRAKQRQIEFKLTFDEWWDIWQSSGKWEQRGCHKGQYVMSRYNDIGAYEVGNVFIQTTEENLSATQGVSRPKPEGFGLKISAIVKGRPSAMKGRHLGYKRKSGPRGPYKKTLLKELA